MSCRAVLATFAVAMPWRLHDTCDGRQASCLPSSPPCPALSQVRCTDSRFKHIAVSLNGQVLLFGTQTCIVFHAGGVS